jgi:Reverse transcriptase (RNA-dependent DNA polymerase)
VNEKLKRWCKEKGIEIHLTAPYSPSQNGIAERMNRTLVELGRAMLKGQDLPEFLWEFAVLHAAYIRNRSYTKPMETLTPFQGWHKRKPDVSHLREFGAPVWILLQGQKETRKMLPKSKRQAYVGFDDGSKAVKYYNAETRKVLISRNFKHLTPSQRNKTPEPIIITPNARPEGESGGSESVMPRLGVTEHDEMDCDGLTRDPNITRDLEPEIMRKRKIEEAFEPRKTRGIRTDYKRLQNPFLVEEDDETNLLASDETFAVIASDELNTLDKAKNSFDWPEWQKAMREELDLLKEKGTWELVQKPPNATPLNNKWTYVKKRNKQGEVNRYKARLVVKGCGQRLGHDYVETFSPVVRLDTLRTILSLVPKYKLKVQQMDIKGAYLNGILQETVYMKQPEGCEDGTD